jgi:hypothetical protein
MINDYNAEYRQINYDTREDYEISHSFIKALAPVYEDIRNRMSEWLPNLKIQISHGGNLSLWVKGRRGEAIMLPQEYNVGQLLVHQVKFLLWVNAQAGKIIAEPDKFFWCTNCGKVHPIENFQDSVFAGHYCKDCYNNNKDIQDVVKQSKQNGFYD